MLYEKKCKASVENMMGWLGRRLERKQIRRPGIQTGKEKQSKLPAGSSVGIGHASQCTVVTIIG